jgi:hypothetical protein
MKKEFYIIIPFDEDENKSIKDNSMMWVFSDFWKSINWASDLFKIRTQIKNFSKTKKWLAWRTNSIKIWLENVWIHGDVLEKNELVQFLTEYYNPSLDTFVTTKNITDYNLINN